jgi:hypothetical protein
MMRAAWFMVAGTNIEHYIIGQPGFSECDCPSARRSMAIEFFGFALAQRGISASRADVFRNADREHVK